MWLIRKYSNKRCMKWFMDMVAACVPPLFTSTWPWNTHKHWRQEAHTESKGLALNSVQTFRGPEDESTTIALIRSDHQIWAANSTSILTASGEQTLSLSTKTTFNRQTSTFHNNENSKTRHLLPICWLGVGAAWIHFLMEAHLVK